MYMAVDWNSQEKYVYEKDMNYTTLLKYMAGEIFANGYQLKYMTT